MFEESLQQGQGDEVPIAPVVPLIEPAPKVEEPTTPGPAYPIKVICPTSKILELRRRGLSVPVIASRLDVAEMDVARVCGLPWWAGQPTFGVGSVA